VNVAVRGDAVRVRPRYLGLAVPLTALVLWEVTARTGHAPDYIVAPSVVLRTMATMAIDGSLWLNIVASLWRVFGGFCIGVAAGIAAGLIAGTWKVAGTYINPLISLIYPIPKIAFLPILIIWLGLGDASKIATIALSVFFPTFINAYGGASDINRQYVWAAQSMGASRLRIFTHVVLPAALPQIFAGARVGLGLAYITLFATELFGARSGLGFLIGLAETGRRFDTMYVAIICIGLAGFLSDRLLIWLRARLLHGINLGKEEQVGA
jgi:ABC-type nitrate/sulfonate/bicarbonate transport system permease component